MTGLELNRRDMLLAGSALAMLGFTPAAFSSSALAQTASMGAQPKPATEAPGRQTSR